MRSVKQRLHFLSSFLVNKVAASSTMQLIKSLEESLSTLVDILLLEGDPRNDAGRSLMQHLDYNARRYLPRILRRPRDQTSAEYCCRKLSALIMGSVNRTLDYSINVNGSSVCVYRYIGHLLL